MAAWIPARATASARSAAACASSSVDTSGASAARASSVAVTARSFSCSANNASSSGCTSPPLSDLVPRVAFAELVEHPALLRNQGHLPLGALERELIVQLLQLPLEPPGFHPVDGELVHLVGIATAETLRLELLVRAGRRVVEREDRIVGNTLEHGAIGRELELLGIDGLGHAAQPWLALQHQEQKSLFGAGGQRGMRDGGCGMRGGAGPHPASRIAHPGLSVQHLLPNPRGFRPA